MVGPLALLSRRAVPDGEAALRKGCLFSGFGHAVTGQGPVAADPGAQLPVNESRRQRPLTRDLNEVSPEAVLQPRMILQNPMFSRPKLAFGPCRQVPPSYMSVNHRNIAGV